MSPKNKLILCELIKVNISKTTQKEKFKSKGPCEIMLSYEIGSRKCSAFKLLFSERFAFAAAPSWKYLNFLEKH